MATQEQGRPIDVETTAETGTERAKAAAVQGSVHVDQTDCCIVGAGPAGAVLALLLAREGVHVTLLEAHHDFDRDFRGDLLMPSTLEIMEQLCLGDRLHQLPHGEIPEMKMETPTGSVPLLNFSRLKTAFPYMMQLPQTRFLELITAEAGRYPSFRLVMGAHVRHLIEEDGVIRGVRYEADDGWHEIRAVLIVGADGRFSKVRQLAGLAFVANDEPMDILWFRLPRRPELTQGRPGLYLGDEGFIVVLPRGPEWQIGYMLPKGHYKQLRSEGLAALREAVVALVPWLTDEVHYVHDWNQTSLLSVESGMVHRWYRRGLLLIGDAAHVMSPLAAVGINCAIRDAVVAANVLGPRLRVHTVRIRDLAAVQRKREWPTRLVQTCQRLIRQRLLGGPYGSSRVSRLLFSIPWARRFVVRALALGVPRVRVQVGGRVAEAQVSQVERTTDVVTEHTLVERNPVK